MEKIDEINYAKYFLVIHSMQQLIKIIHTIYTVLRRGESLLKWNFVGG